MLSRLEQVAGGMKKLRSFQKALAEEAEGSNDTLQKFQYHWWQIRYSCFEAYKEVLHGPQALPFPEAKNRLKSIWDQNFKRPALRGAVSAYCLHLHAPVRDTEPTGQGDAWCGRFAALTALSLALLAEKEGDHRAAREWTFAAVASYHNHPQPNRLAARLHQKMPDFHATGVQALDRALATATGLSRATGVGPLRDLLGELVSGISHSTPVRLPERAVCIPVLWVNGQRSRQMDLHLELLPDGRSEVYPALGRMPWARLAPDLSETLTAAATVGQDLARRMCHAETPCRSSLGGRDLRWWIDDEEALRGDIFLNGGSLGLAAAVGIAQLLLGEIPDPGLVISAGLELPTKGGAAMRLSPVAGIFEKVQALVSSTSKIHTVLVVAENRTEADAAALQLGDDRPFVITVRNEYEALVKASTVRNAVMEYLERMVGLPDRDLPAHLRNPRTPTALWKREFGIPRVVRCAEERATFAWDQLLAQAISPMGVPSEPADDLRWIALLGEPGRGKTILARASAADLAERALSALRNWQVPLQDLVVPIYLSLAEGGSGPLLEQVSQALARELSGTPSSQSGGIRDVSGVVRALFNRKSAPAHTWLFLDGLDHVPNRPAFEVELASLQAQDYRFLLTSRPFGPPDALPLNVRPLALFQLLGLNHKARRTLIDLWFSDRPYARSAFYEWFDRVEGHRSEVTELTQDLFENPLLLTLACFAVEEKLHLDPEFDAHSLRSVTLLFETVLERLLAGGPPPHSRRRHNSPATGCRECLRTVAFQRFMARRPASGFTRTEFADHLREAGVSANLTPQVSALLEKCFDTAVDAGVLVPSGTEVWTFFHPTFQDFLAGEALYTRFAPLPAPNPQTGLRSFRDQIHPHLDEPHQRLTLLFALSKIPDGARLMSVIRCLHTQPGELDGSDLLFLEALSWLTPACRNHPEVRQFAERLRNRTLEGLLNLFGPNSPGAPDQSAHASHFHNFPPPDSRAPNQAIWNLMLARAFQYLLNARIGYGSGDLQDWLETRVRGQSHPATGPLQLAAFIRRFPRPAAMLRRTAAQLVSHVQSEHKSAVEATVNLLVDWSHRDATAAKAAWNKIEADLRFELNAEAGIRKVRMALAKSWNARS